VTTKTIRMPKALLDKWLAALRSGEFKQCDGRLADNGGFCCLGVLQCVADGDVERSEYGGVAHHYPSEHWLHVHSVQFLTENGMDTWTPHLPALEKCASDANDDGKTFAEIADAIEACAEGY
jgi:hypothetical protein